MLTVYSPAASDLIFWTCLRRWQWWFRTLKDETNRNFLKKINESSYELLPDFRRGLTDAELLVQKIVDVGDLERRTQTARDPPQDTHPHHRQIHHRTLQLPNSWLHETRYRHNSCFFTTSPPECARNTIPFTTAVLVQTHSHPDTT